MRTLLICLACIFLIQGCSVPLISNLTSSGITAGTTGKYQQSLAKSAFELAIHHKTGHTPTELILNKLKSKKPAPHS